MAVPFSAAGSRFSQACVSAARIWWKLPFIAVATAVRSVLHRIRHGAVDLRPELGELIDAAGGRWLVRTGGGYNIVTVANRRERHPPDAIGEVLQEKAGSW